MRFSLAVSTDDDAECPPSVRRDALVARARLACEAGFDDIAVTHRYSTVDERLGAGNPPTARMQPIPTLAYLAGVLGDRVGYTTSVLLSPGLHPVQLAEDIATLDVMCAGSLNLGIGLGWVPADFENFQVAEVDRVGRFEELLRLYRGIMGGRADASSSPHFPFPPRLMHSTPVQPGGPPIWIGASSPAGVRRAARLGDAWVMSAHTEVAQLRALQDLHLEARADADLPPPRERPINQVVYVAGTREVALRSAESELKAWYRQREALSGRPPGADYERRAPTPPSTPRWIIGDPRECGERLLQLVEDLDATYVNLVLTWRTGSEGDRRRAIELLGERVLPEVRRSRPARWVDPSVDGC